MRWEDGWRPGQRDLFIKNPFTVLSKCVRLESMFPGLISIVSHLFCFHSSKPEECFPFFPDGNHTQCITIFFFFFPGKALKSMSSYFEINVFLPLREERVGELTLPSSTTLRRWNNFPEMFIGIVVCVCAVTLFVQQSTFLLQLIPWTA